MKLLRFVMITNLPIVWETVAVDTQGHASERRKAGREETNRSEAQMMMPLLDLLLGYWNRWSGYHEKRLFLLALACMRLGR